MFPFGFLHFGFLVLKFTSSARHKLVSSSFHPQTTAPSQKEGKIKNKPRTLFLFRLEADMKDLEQTHQQTLVSVRDQVLKIPAILTLFKDALAETLVELDIPGAAQRIGNIATIKLDEVWWKQWALRLRQLWSLDTVKKCTADFQSMTSSFQLPADLTEIVGAVTSQVITCEF